MVLSDVSNYVGSSMFHRPKPQIGFSSSIIKRLSLLSLFDVQKNDVSVSSKSIFVILVKGLSGSMFDVCSLEPKNRVFEFDHQLVNMLEFVRC